MDYEITIQDEVYNYENIQIAGFKSNVIDFKQLMKDVNGFGCTIQLMNADGIAGSQHALHSAVHALRSFSRGENISKDIGLEICVRASGQRQISQALNILGIKNGEIKVCAVAVDCEDDIMKKLENILGERDDKVLDGDNERLKNIYNLSDTEIETSGNITKLLIERTALLILETK